LQLEVIDFSVGGFALGHLSEVAPGRYMAILQVVKNSDDSESETDERRPIDLHSSLGCEGNNNRFRVSIGAKNCRRQRPPLGVLEEDVLATRTPSSPTSSVKDVQHSMHISDSNCSKPGLQKQRLDRIAFPYHSREEAGPVQGVLQGEKGMQSTTFPSKEMTPSVGSAAHYMGTCKPCAFVYKQGCQSGAACQFCHLCDQTEMRRRKRERKKECKKARQSLAATLLGQTPCS